MSAAFFNCIVNKLAAEWCCVVTSAGSHIAAAGRFFTCSNVYWSMRAPQHCAYRVGINCAELQCSATLFGTHSVRVSCSFKQTRTARRGFSRRTTSGVFAHALMAVTAQACMRLAAIGAPLAPPRLALSVCGATWEVARRAALCPRRGVKLTQVGRVKLTRGR